MRDIIGNYLLFFFYLHNNNETFTYSGMTGQFCFNLSRLNPESSDFNLEISTSYEYQIPVRKPFHKVSCFIKPGIYSFPSVFFSNEGIFYKPFLCKFISVQIPQCNTFSSYIKLSRNSHRDRAEIPVQNIKGFAGQTFSYGHDPASSIIFCENTVSCKCSGFSGAVNMEHLRSLFFVCQKISHFFRIGLFTAE